MESERNMTKVHSIKAKVIGHGSLKSVETLNKRLHWREPGIVYQHDPRHVDVIVKESGLGRGNSAPTPATFDVTEEEKSEPLSQDQHYRCTVQVDRCLTHNQDRAGTIFIVNELCQQMPNHDQTPRLQCLQRQYKSTSTLRAMQKENRRALQKHSTGSKKDWIEGMK